MKTLPSRVAEHLNLRDRYLHLALSSIRSGSKLKLKTLKGFLETQGYELEEIKTFDQLYVFSLTNLRIRGWAV